MILRETIFVLAVSVGVACPLTAHADRAPLALAGRVISETAEPMEGVLVRAKGMGGTVSVTVVTDHGGGYSFPATRLAP